MNKALLGLIATLVVASFSKPANADLILGDVLVYTGGDVTITFQEATAAYHNELQLLWGDGALAIGENHEGGTFTINPADYGYSMGDVLDFVIAVFIGGDHSLNGEFSALFHMGAGSNNPDGMVHAGVMDNGDGTFDVGFEDVLGGGDLDYDDVRFVFSGGVASIPEPGTLLLLGAGLLGIGVRRRMKSGA